MTSQGRMLGEYKLLATYPKRDVCVQILFFDLYRIYCILVNTTKAIRHIGTVKIVSTRTTYSGKFIAFPSYTKEHIHIFFTFGTGN